MTDDKGPLAPAPLWNSRPDLRTAIQELMDAQHLDRFDAELVVLETLTNTQVESFGVPEPHAKLGKVLGALLKETRWPLDELAEQVGLDRTNVQDHLDGKSKPRERNLLKYEEVFGARLNRVVTLARPPRQAHSANTRKHTQTPANTRKRPLT
jgi:hypothetical protein